MKEITKIKGIAEEFNNFFTNVGSDLAKKVPTITSFLNQTQSIMTETRYR